MRPRLPRLFAVAVILILSFTTFTLWRRWNLEYRLTSFSSSIEVAKPSHVVEQNGVYHVTVQPDQEISLFLQFGFTLATHNSSQGHHGWIQLRKRNPISDRYDFVVVENNTTPQTEKFKNGDIVRFFWSTEVIDDSRTAFHTVVTHSRNGRLLETRTQSLDVEFSVENQTDERSRIGMKRSDVDER